MLLHVLQAVEEELSRRGLDTFEVAADEAMRRRGLAGRHEPSAMLFLFDVTTTEPSAEPPAFWMKDVAFPLDLIFFDARGRVVKRARGRAHDEDRIVGPVTTAAVLEVP